MINADPAREPPREVNPVSHVFLLVLILALSAALRFYSLGAESYWIDEIATVNGAQQSIPQLISSGRRDQPLAYYLPLHFWVQIFGTAEAGLRSFSALAGVGSTLLIYLIGRQLFGREVGLMSAFLMAISGFQIYYSQEARYYSLFEFATLLSFLFFIQALRTKRIFHFVLYGLASLMMVYSHSYGVFVLFAQNLFFFLQVKKHRQVIAAWLIVQALVLLAIIPNFYPMFLGENGLVAEAVLNIVYLQTPTVKDILRSVYRFILPARGERSWESILANYTIAAVVFVAGLTIYALRQGKRTWSAALRGWASQLQEEVPNLTGKLLLVGLWLLCPILLPFILSLAIAPIYQDRYLISAAPALYLLLAVGIYSARKVMPLMVSLSVLAIVLVPGLHHYYVTDVKEQWEEAAAYVADNSGPGEVIVFAPNEGREAQQRSFNWYYRGSLPGCGIDIHLDDPAEVAQALRQCTSGHPRFWVIIRGTAETVERFKSFFLNPNQTTMQIIKERQFVGISVYLFELPK